MRCAASTICLRELTFLEEEYQQTGAKVLKALLLAMTAAVRQARTRGDLRLSEAERSTFLTLHGG
jgi:hypothetical protein